MQETARSDTMAQEKLIPFNQRTEDERRAIATQGGIASGKARRRKKAMREWAELIGALPAKVMRPDGTLLEEADLDADVVMQQYRKAHDGNTKAAVFIADLKGERTTNINVSQPVINVQSEADRQRITEAMEE